MIGSIPLVTYHALDSANSNKLIAKYPMTYKRDGSKPPVIHAHGYGGSELEAVDPSNDWYRPTDVIARAGYPVVAGNLGGPATFANSTATDQIADCLTYARSSIVGAKTTGKYFVSGTSMGSAAALAYARIVGASAIAGIVMFVFAPGLQWGHDTGGFATEIEAAYGGNAGYLAALPTRDVMQFASQLAGIPILAFHSSDDTVAVSSVQTAQLDLLATYTDVTRYVTTGGHSLTGKDLTPIQAWLDAHS